MGEEMTFIGTQQRYHMFSIEVPEAVGGEVFLFKYGLPFPNPYQIMIIRKSLHQKRW